MKGLIVVFLKGYKKFISPFLVNILGNACRYNPTCSEYSISVVEKFGARKGVPLAIKRVLSCNNLSKRDYYDPVP